MKRGISLWQAYAYAWITLGLFLFSLAGHWLFGARIIAELDQKYPRR